MSPPLSRRPVKLLTACDPDRAIVSAEIIRGLLPAQLDALEASWGEARRQMGALEHAHWDWRNKADGVESGRYLLVAVACDDEIQGVMAVIPMPRASRIGASDVVYVDYLEAAPWNLKAFRDSPRFLGVGTVLLADADRYSMEMDLGGRVGLHSLPQAESFYSHSRMTRFGSDPDYYDLTYFEYTEQQAMEWLADIGEVL